MANLNFKAWRIMKRGNKLLCNLTRKIYIYMTKHSYFNVVDILQTKISCIVMLSNETYL